MTEREFVRQVRKHSGFINKVVYLYVDDPEDKRDLVQEIQLQAWKAKDRFRGDAQFSTWLYRIALNTVLTFKRKNRIRQTELNEARHEITPQTESSDRRDLLVRAIRRLNDIDKALISLHLEDYQHEEIAGIMGLSKNHVAVKLHRIKERLRKQLNGKKHG